MENKKTVKLIMVTKDNNNKFYDMTEIGDGNFKIEYGRVNSTKTEMIYPMSKWNSIYKQKTGKGYKDVTELYSISEENVKLIGINDNKIATLVNSLQSYANKSVQQNYTISSDAVTQKQVDTAQNLIDNLVKLKTKEEDKINEVLIEIYTTIPRKMSNTKYHLFGGELGIKMNEESLNKIISNEQTTLDVMRGQVSMNTKIKDNSQSNKTLLDLVGIKIEHISDEEAVMINKLLSDSGRTFKNAFKITNERTENSFVKFLDNAKYKKEYFLWHGSRNENWWSILDTGLVLRPANAVISGKMFGYGIYFADKSRKSIGYTSLSGSYWANGNSNKAYLALFRVHTGNWLHLKKHDSWMYNLNESNLKARGDYDSLFAEGGIDLRNNEYIVYNQDQCTVKYLVEIGN